MFLTMMIRHHQGALEMARTEQANGQNADVIGLAKRIEKTKAAEVARMKDLLAS